MSVRESDRLWFREIKSCKPGAEQPRTTISARDFSDRQPTLGTTRTQPSRLELQSDRQTIRELYRPQNHVLLCTLHIAKRNLGELARLKSTVSRITYAFTNSLLHWSALCLALLFSEHAPTQTDRVQLPSGLPQLRVLPGLLASRPMLASDPKVVDGSTYPVRRFFLGFL
jgi:hypothetical protein